MKDFYKNYLENNLFFWIFGGLAILLLIASWFVPPMAVIDKSVLVAVGEIFAFVALGAVIKAVDKGKTATISKGDVNLTIGKDKNE